MSLSIVDDAGATGGVRLVLTGELDLSTVAILRDAMSAALKGSRVSFLTIDLGGVGFLDSTGIAGLIRGRHMADAYGAGYQVVNATGSVKWVLDIAGVLKHLNTVQP